MKIKKILIRILILTLLVSVIALAIVVFTGCSEANNNLSEYDLELVYNDNKTLNGKEVVSYVNNSDIALGCVMFHLYPNAFREGSKSSPVSLATEHKAYPNGKSYGHIKIKNVKVAGMNCSLKLNNQDEILNPSYQITGEDENILQINLTKELYPNEKVLLEIEFDIKIPNVNHRFGYGNETINLGNFYPIACVYSNGEFKTDLYHANGDPFYSEMANYNVKITYPSNLICANTGTKISTETANNLTTTQIKAKKVRDFAMVLSDKFQTISQTADGVEITYYYFSDKEPEKSLDIAKKSIETFNNLIGKYPYKTLAVVEANFVHGGMEYPNLIYIASDITDHTQYEQVIVHETAHQWWYNLVGNSEYDNAWLDEGLTEYTTALFYELNPNYEIKKDTIIKTAYSNYQLFVEVYGTALGEVDSSMDRPLNKFASEQEYVYLTYIKGMLLFDNIREIIGMSKFKKCLKQYFQDHEYKIATPESMIASFEKASGLKLENIFKSWIDGKVIIIN